MTEHQYTIFEIYFRYYKNGDMVVIDAPNAKIDPDDDFTVKEMVMDNPHIVDMSTLKGDFAWWGEKPYIPGLYYGQAIMDNSESTSPEYGTEYDCDFGLLYYYEVKKKTVKPRILRTATDEDGNPHPVTNAFDLVFA